MVNLVHIYSQVLANIFNDCVKRGKFTDILKYDDITPVFKKVIRLTRLTIDL